MLTDGDLSLGLLVRGQFDTGAWAAFSGLGDVEWDGVTYTGVGQALSIGESSSSIVDGKAGIVLTLSGIDPELLALAELEEFQRRRVTIYLAVFGGDGQITDAEVYFDGLADDMESDDDPENATITLRCEQRALDLSRPRPFKYLPGDQNVRYPGDQFFSLVQVIQNREDVWGE